MSMISNRMLRLVWAIDKPIQLQIINWKLFSSAMNRETCWVDRAVETSISMNENFPLSDDEDQQKIDEDAMDQVVESWEKNHKSRTGWTEECDRVDHSHVTVCSRY